MTNNTNPSPSFISEHSRARWVTIFLGLGIALDLVAIASCYAQIGLLSSIIAREPVTRAAMMANDIRQSRIGLAQFWVYLVTVVFFLRWIHRAYRNLPALGEPHPEHSPRWAVGGFFVPFLNLVRPFQIVREIWCVSDPGFSTASSEFGFVRAQAMSAPTLVKAWWASFLIASAAGNFVARMTRSGGRKTAEDLWFLTWLIIATDLLSVVAAILAILVIRNIDQRQETKNKLLATATASPDNLSAASSTGA